VTRKLIHALLIWLGAAAVLLAVYRPALEGTRLLDDDVLIYGNANLQDAGGLWRTWTQPESSPDYYPLTYTTWWVEGRLAGLEPWVLHVDNVLLHAASVVVLGLLLRRIGLEAPAAWLTAALFALHPVQVESVAWMAQRKSTLSGLFFLLSAYAFVRGAMGRAVEPSAQAREPAALHAGWYALSLFLFACAMLSKPVTMTLAASLVLVAWMCRGGLPARRDLARILPFFLLALPMAVLTATVQRTRVMTVGPDFELGALHRLFLAGRVFWFYLGKLAFPVDLTFAYPRWDMEGAEAMRWALAPVAAAGVLIGAWLARKRLTDGPWMALAFFAITLSPALGFLPIYWHLYYYVADHVQYLAMIGPCALAAAVLGRWIARGEALGGGRWIRGSLIALAAGGLVALGARSSSLAAEYRDAVTLWEATRSRNPDALIAYRSLAKLYCQRAAQTGDASLYQRSLDVANEGLARGETFPEIQFTISDANFALGRFEAAAEAARTGLRLDAIATRPKRTLERSRMEFTLGTALLSLCWAKLPAGDRGEIQRLDAEATAALERAVELEPGFDDGWYNLGNLHLLMGRYDESIQANRMALKARPTYAKAMTNIGLALSSKGDAAGARRAFEDSLRISPTGEAADVARQGLAALR
jgi:protein O-mannosyl-transferase